MIAPERHVYAYYLWQAKGNMRRAADMNRIDRDTFVSRLKSYGLNFRKFRGKMCTCKRGKIRCDVCKTRNRSAAKLAYYDKKTSPKKTIQSPINMANNAEKVRKLMLLSGQMAVMQRFLQLSK